MTVTSRECRLSQDDPARSKEDAGSSSRLSYVVTFVIMACFWAIFSAKFDLFHIVLGLFSCLLVSLFSSRLMFPNGVRFSVIGRWLRFCTYIPWLLLQIMLANLHVMRLVFHPRMMELIDPQIIEFETRLKSDFARTTFANSITLTPGTITVNVSALGRFSVHCIDTPSGQSLPGNMEVNVARVFGE